MIRKSHGLPDSAGAGTVAFLSRLLVMVATVHDLDGEVFAWARDQLEKSAAGEVWLAINSTIAPVEGRPVAGFMILTWCRSPILGDPAMSTGTLITGVPTELAVRDVIRKQIATLREQKAAALRTLPAVPRGMNGLRGTGAH